MKRDQEDQDFKRTSKLAQPVKVPIAKHNSGSPLGPRRETTPTKLSCHMQMYIMYTHMHRDTHVIESKDS